MFCFRNLLTKLHVMDFLKILFLLQNDRFMEITEAFHPQTPIATPMGVNSVDPDPIGGRGLLHEGRGNPPKRSPNCNGHPASSSIQVYRDGEISFIPLQERGIILHGKRSSILKLQGKNTADSDACYVSKVW